MKEEMTFGEKSIGSYRGFLDQDMEQTMDKPAQL